MWILATQDNSGVVHNLVGPFSSEDDAFAYLDRWEEFFGDLESDIVKGYTDHNLYCDTIVMFMNHPDKMWS